MKILIISIILIFFFSNGYSLDPNKSLTQFIHQIIDDENGLPQNTAVCTLQTKDGYIWIGTQEGLVRYDGLNFKVYDKENTPELKHNSIYALYEDKNNNLWIGTLGGGVSLYKNKNFTNYSTKNGLSNDIVRALYEDRSGNIWIGTNGGGVNLYKDGRFTKISTKDGLCSDIIKTFYEDKDGNMWIGSLGSGISIYKDGKFINYSTKNGLSHNLVKSIIGDSKGNVWIGTQGGGVQLYKDGNFTNYTTKDGLCNDQVNALYEDKDKNIWIGTNVGGISIYKDGFFSNYSSSNGLNNDQVLSLYEDTERNMWIGTLGGGINLYKDGKFTNFTTRNGLSHDIIRTIFKDRKGNLWIGTSGGGINIFQDGKFTNYSTKNGLCHDRVIALYEDSQGSMWIGTLGGGVDIYKDGKFINYSTKNGLSHDMVISLCEDNDGNMWIGTQSNGVNLFKDGKFICYTSKNGLCHDMARTLYKDSKGSMWVGSNGGGISIYKDGKFVNYTTKNGLSHDMIVSFYEDKHGNMWIGTFGGGLNLLKDSKFTYYTSKQGLYDDIIGWIQEDNNDNLWMTCNKGIFRININDVLKYDKKEINNIPCVSYGLKDGLLTQECNAGSPAGWMNIETNEKNEGVRNYSGQIGKVKTLYFPTIKGYTSIDPDNIKYNKVIPAVHIEEVIVNGISYDMSVLSELKNEQNNISFKYTACSFLYPKAMKFKIMLEGYDKEWLELAYDKREKEYTNLPSGKYTFKVKACNNDGLWNDKDAAYSFTILPAFTETIWFFSFCGLGIFMFGFSIYQIRVARLKARERELQRRVDEQTIEIKEKAKTIEIEKEKSDRLLLNVLPEDVANELKENNYTIPKKYELVSVLFTDLVGFTKIAETFTPEELIDELGKVFEYFDNVVLRNKCEKIKTIGDGYLCAAGIPKANVTNPVDIVLGALEIANFMNMTKKIKQELSLPYWELRIGINTGPVMAGVVGKSKFSYDIWGDTVNTASRMESSGIPGKINISETTYHYVKDLFICEYRGKVPAKNKGEIEMYLVEGIKPDLSVDGECLVPNDKFRSLYNQLNRI